MPPFLSRQLFPPWVPDQSDQLPNVSADVSNVIPIASGWAPFPSFTAFSQSLPAPCRGFFYGKNPDGTVAIFAGTAAAKLYQLDNSTLTWTDVSLGGGTYSTLSAGAQWQFVQFNSLIIAVQANCAPQVFTLQSSTAFSNLGGSPPAAAFISVVNRFLVLSGIASSPYRVQWSDLDNPTQWTAGVGQSDFQDLP